MDISIDKRPSKWWAIIIGTGLALLPIHNLWLTQLVTDSSGDTKLFMPSFGYVVLIMGTAIFLINNWERVREVGLGNRRIVGCLLFIVLAIALSGANADGWQDKIAPLGMGLALLAVYLVARILGKEIFLPLAVGAGIASLGVIIHGFMYPGQTTGGFIFGGNYDIVVGYVLLGTALLYHQKQWMLATVALVGLFFTGADEALFACGVLLIVVLIRRDWSKRILVPACALIVTIAVCTPLGITQQLYFPAVQKTAAAKESIEDTPAGHIIDKVMPDIITVPIIKFLTPKAETSSETHSTDEMLDEATGGRWTTYWKLLFIKPLGEGYNLTDFSKHPNVHNVPLVIVQQLGWPGILAGLAWLWISLWCLVKTRWKYAWALILILSVFDHYIWTQLAPYWWVLVGVSSASRLRSDLIFKGIK